MEKSKIIKKRGKMKKAQQLLSEHTLNVIIAILCIILLIYLSVRMYDIFSYKNNFEDEDIYLRLGDTFVFRANDEDHSIILLDIEEKKARLIISSFPTIIDLFIGDVRRIDLDYDSEEDLELKLISSDVDNGQILLHKSKIREEISGKRINSNSYIANINSLEKIDAIYSADSLPECVYPECVYVEMDDAKIVSKPDKLCTSGVDGCIAVIIISGNETAMLHVRWQTDSKAEELIQNSISKMKGFPKKAFIVGGYKDLSESVVDRIKKGFEEQNVELVELKEHLLNNEVLTVFYDTETSTLSVFGEPQMKYNQLEPGEEKRLSLSQDLEKKLNPLIFFNKVEENNKIVLDNFGKKIAEEVENKNCSVVIIGEYHYQENQRNAAVNILEELAKKKKIVFLEEGYGNTDTRGGEIFTKMWLLNKEGNSVETKKYEDFLNSLGIESKKIFDQFSPCEDVKRELLSLKDNEVLVTYTGVLHTSEEFYNFSGTEKSKLMTEIPVKNCVDELNKCSITIMMFDLNPLIEIAPSLGRYYPGEIEKSGKGEFFIEYKEKVYVGAFWDNSFVRNNMYQ